jgi:hypothetical protein
MCGIGHKKKAASAPSASETKWFGIVEYEVEPLPNSDHHAIFAKLALPVR